MQTAKAGSPHKCKYKIRAVQSKSKPVAKIKENQTDSSCGPFRIIATKEKTGTKWKSRDCEDPDHSG
ncbi:hypothetical protein NPIL_468401 [Nephila pilipes]|uniref:Uncharacterized protein n=1 Tax=Nephila pilipes TaxID=299642 RepID=A0A8X6MDM4_NEPPI|nr:hypothetical protein NPIL_468401 [Nephila pilipes]